MAKPVQLLARTSFGAVWVLVLAAGHGCANHVDQSEGDYINPPGFNTGDTHRVSMAPHGFRRDPTTGGILSTTATARALRRQAAHQVADANEDLKLETRFLGTTYEKGMRVNISSRLGAYLDVVPEGASQADGRVRNDGAIVAFENAYRNVTSVFGATQSKVEEFLKVPTPADMPSLAYKLKPGPDFGQLIEGNKHLWAYAKDGKALFSIAPPSVQDANGKVIEGTWQTTSQSDGVIRMVASLDLAGVAYPVLIDPAFETPQWFLAQGGSQPTPRGAAAAAYHEIGDGSNSADNCSVVFGGIGGNAAFADAYTYCNAIWNPVTYSNIGPSARSYMAMGSVPFGTANTGLYVFGGYTATAVSDELWQLTLSSGVGPKTGTWTQIAYPNPKTASNWPSVRYAYGAAWTGNKLVIWGGVDNTGNTLTDTWEYDPAAQTWNQVCASCFVKNYGFATAILGTWPSAPVIYAMGGFSGDVKTGAGSFTSTIQQYTGGTGWTTVGSPNPAVLPLASDGTLSTCTGASGSSCTPFTTPTGRYFAWAGRSPQDRLIWGSGLSTASNGTDTYYPDMWLWNSASGYNRWEPVMNGNSLSVVNNLDTTNSREASMSVYDFSNNQLVLFGGFTDSIGNARQDGQLYRGSNATITNLVVTRAAGNQVTLTATLSSEIASGNIQGYFVSKKTAGNWDLVGGTQGVYCGDPGTSATVSGNQLTCTTTYASSAAVEHNFGVLVRDGSYYDSTIGGTGTNCSDGTTLPKCNGQDTGSPVYSGIHVCLVAAFSVGTKTCL